jgi:hypothetical protein
MRLSFMGMAHIVRCRRVARRLLRCTHRHDDRAAHALHTTGPHRPERIAWLLGKSGVAAPIVGASKPGHQDDAVAVLALTLSSEDVAALEAQYLPHPVVGFE